MLIRPTDHNSPKISYNNIIQKPYFHSELLQVDNKESAFIKIIFLESFFSSMMSKLSSIKGHSPTILPSSLMTSYNSTGQ